MGKRKYTKSRRAESQQKTRERIVDAAIALHEELGPAATTISALAERAGVQRLTVYRHFANEEELFGACSSKWFGLNPAPQVAAIPRTTAAGHTRAVLLALYRYYGATSKMWHSVYRDLDKVPAVEAPVALFESYLVGVAESILENWGGKDSAALRATVGHAVRFSTWRSLARSRLTSSDMAQLAASWVQCIASRDEN